ncbi:MAG: UDP-N-acetylmuramate:L-alanyl-gamma-D-glutamyl-meso-diaminopimelate ligase [Gammaproteobacteria bacterium]|nr:UDP-N-acetylmuramate:L-alanyl-gamma-D-glutamyl-meso-diaminopimelate ligase [Gammaproteobacteria bacterium]
MKIYILGICGTFMAGIALLAREIGYEVGGSDANVYPPMSTQLSAAGIELDEGYDPKSLHDDIDMFIIGNVVSRGNPQFEAILNNNRSYCSGPQWLYEVVLRDRWVLAVAGTHGKTTTSSMLSWILQYAGLQPGYLIGGVSQNFSKSSCLGESPFFVIEADEYDTALFDKRSKFVHYHPRTLVLNNLEFDHADIFDDLSAIKRQFHHLVRMMSSTALIIYNQDSRALSEVLELGCWSECLSFSQNSSASDFSLDQGSQIKHNHSGKSYPLQLQQTGIFNACNAAAAALAARHAGVPLEVSLDALSKFRGVKRRQEIIAEIGGIRVIDDFAHHPTAIELTLTALKAQTRGRLYAVIDIRSNTMKMGVQASQFARSTAAADTVLLCENDSIQWDIHAIKPSESTIIRVKPNVEQVIMQLLEECLPDDQIVIMSNGGFDNMHERLVHALQSRQSYDS